MDTLKRFIYEEDAMGTVEVILISAVLVGVGIMFKEKISEYARGLLNKLDDVTIDVNNIEG